MSTETTANMPIPEDSSSEEKEPDYVTKDDLNEVVEHITQTVNRTITGAIGRVKKDNAKETEATLKGLFSQFIPPEQKDSNLESEEKENSLGTTPEQNGGGGQESLKDQVSRLLEWRGQQEKRLRQQVKITESQGRLIESLKQENAETKRQAQAEKIKTDWIKIAADRVHAPDQLLQLALSGGQLVLSEEGVPVVLTNELQSNGEYKQLRGEEAIASLLKLPEFGHFRKGGAGGGTGFRSNASPPTQESPTVIEGIPLDETDEQRLNRISKEYGFN